MKYLNLAVLMLWSASASAEYRVPTVDAPESSAPSISGETTEIIGNMLIVQRGDEEISVLTDGETHIFTFYGGVVLLHEICPGSKIDIWYPNAGANRRIATAASIRVPTTCW